MQYRQLGRSGLRVSALSFGSWVTFGGQVGQDSAQAMMSQAYDAGVNFFDNAEVYANGESERIMGRALDACGWPRDSFCVSSKVFWGGDKPTQRGLSRKHVVEACHAALARLRVDYLDFYFCHRPDPTTPIEETVLAMHTLVMQGKILYWGTSEWNAQQLTAAYDVAEKYGWTPPTMEQPQYNLFERTKVEAEFAPLYDRYGLGTTIWSPLASGVLTGKYSQGIPADARLALPGYEGLRARYSGDKGAALLAKAARLAELASELNITPAALAIAWCLKNPHVSTVILGASRAGQLKANLLAVEATAMMSDEVMARVEDIVDNAPLKPRNFLVR